MSLKDHLEKLAHFYEVAKAGTFVAASARLKLTQPSVTKSIKVLEEALDVKLFVRQPRGVLLTEEGQVLFSYCHTLFSQLEDVEVRLKTPDQLMAGCLRVGTYDSIAIYFWPHFLRGFLKKYPSLELELTTNRSHKLQAMVEDGELDLALIIEPTASAKLNVVSLKTDAFHLYRSKKVSSEEANHPGTPLIFMPDALAGTRSSRLSHLLSSSSHQRKLFKTSSLESTKELVVQGIGIGLLPEMVARDALDKKKIVAMNLKGMPKSGVGQHRIGLVYPKHKKNSTALQGLIAEIENYNW